MLIVNEEETKMAETKTERYVTYAEFDDFKKHDFQEVRDDIKDIRTELKGIHSEMNDIRMDLSDFKGEMRGELKSLNVRIDQIFESLKFYKMMIVVLFLTPLVDRMISFFFEH